MQIYGISVSLKIVFVHCIVDIFKIYALVAAPVATHMNIEYR